MSQLETKSAYKSTVTCMERHRNGNPIRTNRNNRCNGQNKEDNEGKMSQTTVTQFRSGRQLSCYVRAASRLLSKGNKNVARHASLAIRIRSRCFFLLSDPRKSRMLTALTTDSK